MAPGRSGPSGGPRTEDSWLRLLGPFTVESGGAAVPLGGLRQRAVLALLAIYANEVVSRDTLVEELWGGDPPPSAISTLHGYLSHLRRALVGTPFAVVGRHPGYVLDAPADRIDAHRFLHRVEQARTALDEARATMAIERLDEALSWWRGPALADFAGEPFARAEATRLEETRLTALSLRMEARLALGQHQEAAAGLEQLVAAHPLREDFRGQLMRALTAGGRRAEALRSYQEGRKTFAEELGLDPSLALQRLERAILAQDPSVEPTPTRVGRAGRLPVPATSFVGREQDLTDVTGLIRRRRMLTITGPGGIGKTRLALEAARTVAAEFADGVFLVELAGVTDADLVASTVAEVLGAQPQPDGTVLDSIERTVSHRRCLVVIDNCEHVLDAASLVATALLRSGSDVTVLATSRQALRVPGEAIWSVPTLPVPETGADATAETVLGSDAVRLFAERADAAWPGFEISPINASAVTRICQRLDGMPLAIELAAARLRTLSVEQVADRLDDRFRLLVDGDRTALPRYRTLQASVEWSHDLLEGSERVFFRRAAVFSGPFDLGAAEAVCAGTDVAPEAVVGLCAELVDRSLLTRVKGPHGEPRYRMLETLRQFGLERLSAGHEEHDLRQAHARAFTDRAEAAVAHLHRPDASVWVGQLDADRADLRAALEWLVEAGDPALALRLATGLWLFWRYRDEAAEGRRWLERALTRGDHGPAERLAATVAKARLALNDSDTAAAETACAEGLALLGPDDDWSRAHLNAVRAEALRFLGSDARRAEELASDAVAEFHRQEDKYWEAHARRVLAQLAWDQGDLARATTLAGQCLGLFEACGDAEGVAGSKITLAGMARDAGDLERATRFYDESLTAFRLIDQPWGQAEAARHFGTLVLGAGDDGRAEELGRESLRLCENLGLGRGIGNSYELLAKVAFERGELEHAEELGNNALKHLRAGGYPGDVATTAVTVGHIALHRGRLDRAAELLQDSLGSPRGFGYRRNRAPALSLLSRVRSRQGMSASVALAEEAVELARQDGDARWTASGLEALAEALAGQGQAERAARLLLVARYTRQMEEIGLSHVERVDHDEAVAAVTAGLDPGEFALAWRSGWDENVVDLSVLESLAATPDLVLEPSPTGWDGADRRREERRDGERRLPHEVEISPSVDRRADGRRRWHRRRSDRVP